MEEQEKLERSGSRPFPEARGIGLREWRQRHIGPRPTRQTSAARAAVKGAKRPAPKGLTAASAVLQLPGVSGGAYRLIPKPRSLLLVLCLL